jgi:hypothetical protein
MTEAQLQFLTASRRELRRSKILSLGAVGVALVAVLAVVAAGFAVLGWREAEIQAVGAERARSETEAAYGLAQTRMIEGQAVQARTDARLLDIVQEFKRYDAYKETIEEWKEEFQVRADELNSITKELLPPCDDVGQFTVYEKQLVLVPVDELPVNEAMFAFLAVVPGSGAKDWAPAVLDVFFAGSDALVPRRDLERRAVKKMMAAVAPDDQWGLLVGLGTEHILTHGKRNYRLKRTDLRTNADGDMIMAFSVCLEASPEASGPTE